MVQTWSEPGTDFDPSFCIRAILLLQTYFQPIFRDESIYLSKLLFLDSSTRVMQCTGWKENFLRGCHRWILHFRFDKDTCKEKLASTLNFPKKILFFRKNYYVVYSGTCRVMSHGNAKLLLQKKTMVLGFTLLSPTIHFSYRCKQVSPRVKKRKKKKKKNSRRKKERRRASTDERNKGAFAFPPWGTSREKFSPSRLRS